MHTFYFCFFFNFIKIRPQLFVVVVIDDSALICKLHHQNMPPGAFFGV